MKKARTDAALREGRRLREERRSAIAEVIKTSSLLQQTLQQYLHLFAKSQALLEQVRSRIAQPAAPPSPDAPERAMKAAIAAYDAAMLSPSAKGLPSHVAIAAYI